MLKYIINSSLFVFTGLPFTKHAIICYFYYLYRGNILFIQYFVYNVLLVIYMC